MLTRLVRATGLTDRLRAVWRHDAEQVAKPLRAEIRRLQRDVDRLTAALQDAAERGARGDRVAAQVRSVLHANERDRERLAEVDAVLWCGESGSGRYAARVPQHPGRPRGLDPARCAT